MDMREDFVPVTYKGCFTGADWHGHNYVILPVNFGERLLIIVILSCL